MASSPPPLPPDDRRATGSTHPGTRYRGQSSADTVQGLIVDSATRFAEDARIGTRLVVLAEHRAVVRREAPAHSAGARGVGLPRVLLVRSRNADRSQPAAALSAHRSARRVSASSTGTDRPVADAENAPIAVVRGETDARDARTTETLASLPST
ncbi:hypothetical protein ACFWWT_14815 [Streptomyces sp. NPDC058676]|uniref:hypothetical protein n=1 Tax=unclassified Streptomyces TaxID=2593676 RepID=UPI0036471964